jgi:hypothetical protein
MPRTAIRSRRPLTSLTREIILALILKCVLLYALWWAFFSHAPDKRVIADTVAEHLLAEHLAGTHTDLPTPPRSPSHD